MVANGTPFPGGWLACDDAYIDTAVLHHTSADCVMLDVQDNNIDPPIEHEYQQNDFYIDQPLAFDHLTQQNSSFQQYEQSRLTSHSHCNQDGGGPYQRSSNSTAAPSQPSDQYLNANVYLDTFQVDALTAMGMPPTTTQAYTASTTASQQVETPQPAFALLQNPQQQDCALPDTYAGRRSAQGRENFPRECAVCGRRYLYDDSARKHYRAHHKGEPNIILRYAAPKRPPPGHPRNTKSARSQARRRVRPSVTVPKAPSQGKVSRKAHHPMQICPLDGLPVKLESAGQAGPIPTGTTALPAVANSNVPFFGASDTAGPSIAADTSRTRQTDIPPHSTDLIYPFLLRESQAGRNFDIAFQEIYSTNRSTNASADTRPPSQALDMCSRSQIRPRATMANQLPLPPLTPYNAPDTAQEAIRGLRIHAGDWPVAAQEAISQLRPQSAQQHDQVPLAEWESLRSAAPARTVAPNIMYLQTLEAEGRIPPLPPSQSYDETDSTLTWHEAYGKYYRRVGEVWVSWDDRIFRWVWPEGLEM